MEEVEPADYAETLGALKRRVHDARFTLQRRANAELVALYWHIGDTILKKQRTSAWGDGVVTQLASDLQAEFPTMRGFSRANLYSMRAFAGAWPKRNGIVQQPVGQLPWTHIVQLLEKLDDQALREWYAGKDVQHTWSRAGLLQHIEAKLHDRDDAAPSDFAAALSRPDSDLAQQLTRDPYTTGFVGVDADLPGEGPEERLTLRIATGLHDLDSRLAFVERQPHAQVDSSAFFIDLLFFHVEQLRYVVFQLRAGPLDQEDTGRFVSAVASVEDRLRVPDRHAPTVGTLLVFDENDTAVRYARAGAAELVAVAREELSVEEQAAVPAEEALTRLAAAFTDAG